MCFALKIDILELFKESKIAVNLSVVGDLKMCVATPM